MPRLKQCGGVIAHCNLKLLGSSNPPASASQIAEIIGARHHAQLIFKLFVEMWSHYVAQAGLELLATSDPPALATKHVLGLQYEQAHLARQFKY